MTGAHDGPGMWMWRGAAGVTRPGPRRVGPARMKRTRIQTKKRPISPARISGIIAMSEPQSGLTSVSTKWRSSDQSSSIMRGSSAGQRSRAAQWPDELGCCPSSRGVPANRT